MVSEDASLLEIAATLLKLSMNKESQKINKNVTFENSFTEEESDGRKRSRNRNRNGRDRGRSGAGRDRERTENRNNSRQSFDRKSNQYERNDDFNPLFEKKSRNKSDLPSLDELIASVNSIKKKEKKKPYNKDAGAFGKKSSFKNKKSKGFSKKG